ncbi:MAG: glycosyl hydrolase [Planctomycetaceae bacterium]
MNILQRSIFCVCACSAYAAVAAADDAHVITPAAFKNPAAVFRPVTTFGVGEKDSLPGDAPERLEKAYRELGYGGVMVAPTAPLPTAGGSSGPNLASLRHSIGLPQTRPAGSSPWVMIAPPGTSGGIGGFNRSFFPSPDRARSPDYLSEAYFGGFERVLEYSQQNGRKVVFYDEVGFPSGMANHTAPEMLTRQVLRKTEQTIDGPTEQPVAIADVGSLVAVVAMNTATRSRVNLMPLVHENELMWKAPAGNWKLMVFHSVRTKPRGAGVDYHGAVNYLDPVAVQWFVDTVYEPHARKLGRYFGNTLNMTFFDDVGIWPDENTWTAKFNECFEAYIGKDPAVYYPALWEDIGPETEAARVAFFDTRAELLADGFPKIVTEWGAKNNVEVSGHCPGNYDLQPVDMNGDPFKFYRAQPVPMADVIFGYPHGRDGFKLISDGADLYDKPVVAAETFGPFAPAGHVEGYRRVMELYIRGITRLVGASGGRGAPGVGGPATFAEWAGRNSQMLQGGRRVSEIAIFYPIVDLQAYYRFDAPEFTKEMRSGTFVPHHADFAAIGEMLLNEAHRDFTFLHPDVLLSARVKLHGPSLKLDNPVNWQSWRVLILPGQKVISLRALEKIKAYYDGGGVILATSQLPSKAAELAGSEEGTLANDRKVQGLVKSIFGLDPVEAMPGGVSPVQRNAAGGASVFICVPTSAVLGQTLDKLGVTATVRFDGNPIPSSGGGVFSYVHKVKEGRQIYFFANSSNDEVDTTAEVRGRIRPELWDPMTGEVRPLQADYVRDGGEEYTRFPLKLNAVSATFVVGS